MKVKDFAKGAWYAQERDLLRTYADVEVECYIHVEVPETMHTYAVNYGQTWTAFVFKGARKYFGILGGLRVSDDKLPSLIALCESGAVMRQKPTPELLRWALLNAGSGSNEN